MKLLEEKKNNTVHDRRPIVIEQKQRLTYVTGLAGVSLWTGAVVLVWFGVHAGSSVDTRLVATAVIQIWMQPHIKRHRDINSAPSVS